MLIASAIQRAGRAGRVREGSCLRLYTETDFERDFLEQSPPEIVSTDLAPILLLLADWGASTLSEILHDMPFVDAPEQHSLERAERFLVEIDSDFLFKKVRKYVNVNVYIWNFSTDPPTQKMKHMFHMIILCCTFHKTQKDDDGGDGDII